MKQNGVKLLMELMLATVSVESYNSYCLFEQIIMNQSGVGWITYRLHKKIKKIKNSFQKIQKQKQIYPQEKNTD